MSERTRANGWLALGAALGGATVVLGAFAAHGLEGRLSSEALEWWRTAVQYQGLNALATLGWALFRDARGGTARADALPGWGFALGTLFFSGSLYAMALGAPRWLGAITPLGGTLMIVGWAAFAWQALRARR
jgi:uncharacterized membrane protein YgdD (TMEM256/DUF423 family)